MSRSQLRAKFFKGVDSDRDYVEISIVGSKDTIVHKVKPEHIEQFAPEWDAYQNENPEVEIDGTPLTDVPGVDKTQAMGYKLAGVRTAEELAACGDDAVSRLGMGALEHRKAAQLLMKANAADAAAAPPEPPSPPPKPKRARAKPEAVE